MFSGIHVIVTDEIPAVSYRKSFNKRPGVYSKTFHLRRFSEGGAYFKT